MTAQQSLENEHYPENLFFSHSEDNAKTKIFDNIFTRTFRKPMFFAKILDFLEHFGENEHFLVKILRIFTTFWLFAKLATFTSLVLFCETHGTLKNRIDIFAKSESR
jgi:hypothetical protein